MGNTALITGGSGYFGTVLRDSLRAAGTAVRVFDLADSSDRPHDVEFVQGDIRDAAAVDAVCRGADLVFHNVAQVPLAKDRGLFESVNVGGTANLLRAAEKAGIRKLIHTSSSAIFGVPRRNPVDETTEPAPREAYGQAKLDGERLVLRAAGERRIDATIIRPRTVLGHGRLGIFAILFDWVADGRRIPVLGGGQNVYQFVHASDLADACMRAAARPGSAIYNIGAERFGTMRESLEALCRHAGTGASVRSIPLWPAEIAMNLTSALGLSPLGPYHALMYGRSLYFDISRAKAELAWQPRWSNEEMLCESYDRFLAARASLPAAGQGSAHRSAVRQGILGWLKRVS